MIIIYIWYIWLLEQCHIYMYVLGNWVKFPAGEVDLGRWAALEGKSPPPPNGCKQPCKCPMGRDSASLGTFV
jgi:hypothetical protein